MKHIEIIGRGKPVAPAASILEPITCNICMLKNGGDFDACVDDKGKCERPSRT